MSKGGVGLVRACPYRYNTHLAVLLHAILCDWSRMASKIWRNRVHSR
ncbi:hypothetical protein IVW58_04850 [Salmonella enterica subsp. enterica serovar Worthington]|nr:hypothetical protein [Salmonella enterica subsp. enterica serovar Worthington]